MLGELLHPPHHAEEGEGAACYGLLPKCNINLMLKCSYVSLMRAMTHNRAPRLMCGIEADQHRGEDIQVLQAEVQLSRHKRSLSDNEQQLAAGLQAKMSDSDQTEPLTDSPQEMPINKTCLFPSQACMVEKNGSNCVFLKS